MEDIAVGRLLRLARVRARRRQEDVAAAAGVSRATVSRMERGQLGGLTIGTIRGVCATLDIRVSVQLAGEGATLDRLAGAAHSAMHEETARLFGRIGDWVTLPEITFSIRGERGIIDILAWHAETRSLLVIELKTELADMQAMVGTLDRKVRLAREIARERGWEPLTVSAWLLIADGRTNRRHVRAHSAFLRSRYGSDGHAMLRWLRRPAGRIEALSFLSAAHEASGSRRMAPVRRVRRRRASVGSVAA